MVTGENSGTWGDKTNTNLNLVQQAIAGYEAVKSIATAQTTALQCTDGSTALSNARNAVIELTGTITGNQIVTIPDGIEKTYLFIITQQVLLLFNLKQFRNRTYIYCNR
jgi:hypothetical protein